MCTFNMIGLFLHCYSWHMAKNKDMMHRISKSNNLNNTFSYLFQVTHVSWNEPYQKLASCDSSGVIFVWIKYEGRWSIELINDRQGHVHGNLSNEPCFNVILLQESACQLLRLVPRWKEGPYLLQGEMIRCTFHNNIKLTVQKLIPRTASS